ncbi:MAG TPA: cytochrome c family protein [Alphaproteobacteria bacterium]|nr:cytochrome c family protein [Alphaproteobacteria bacterium]
MPLGNPERGAKIYARCQACHSIDRDRTGPRHADLFGRRAGSIPGFPYSAAMRKAGAAGLVWNAKTLDKFLRSPTAFIPGPRMGYAGIKNDQERIDLISPILRRRPGNESRSSARHSACRLLPATAASTAACTSGGWALSASFIALSVQRSS